MFCGHCLDPETYNTDDNKPSNTFSQCPQQKTKCDTKGMVECDEPYRSNDPDSKYKMDRRCRCAYEKNYIPRFYDEKKDIWRCITASELTCDERKCDPVDGVAHSRGEGSYHMDQNIHYITANGICKGYLVFSSPEPKAHKVSL